MHLSTSYVNSHVSLATQDGFEGPEKRLEVQFGLKDQFGLNKILINSSTLPKDMTFRGLRCISQHDWQEMLDLAKCTIISSTSNHFLDSYVLSESSLFVYPTKLILKTCGTTTLLNCLDKLIEYGERVGLKPEFVVFSRKNFNYPHKQPHPHSNFETEVQILNRKFHGSAHILGPVLNGGDHHFIYFANLIHQDVDQLYEQHEDSDEEWIHSKVSRVVSSKKLRPTVEILMSQLDPVKMKQFYRDENFVDAKTTTSTCGLSKILPNMITDEFVFDPCGYSLNAISNVDGSYATVHITPEPHCSFVSFEADIDCNNIQRNALIQSVVEAFRPGRFSVLVTSDHPLPLEPFHRGFSCKFKTQYEFEEGFYVSMQNYISNQNEIRRCSTSPVFYIKGSKENLSYRAP